VINALELGNGYRNWVFVSTNSSITDGEDMIART